MPNSRYDALGRITGSSQTMGTGTPYTFSYGWNLAGALTSETYPSNHTVTMTVDGANRPLTLARSDVTKTYVQGLSYAPHGGPLAFKYANGINRAQSFTNLLQPQKLTDWLTTVGANNPLLDLNYTYGGGSQSSANPTQIAIKTAAVPSATQTSYAQSFAYDSANRLCLAAEGITVSSCSSAVSGNTWAQQFGYDRYGNMSGTSTGPSGIPALPAAGSYNTSNQLTSSGVGYDFAGNQTAIGSSWLSYDAENRQTVDHDTVSGNYTNYGYDGMGERVTKALTGGASTVYVHDAFGNLAAEYTTGGATTMACTTCYLSWDHLGSTRMVTDQNGAVVPYGRHDYLPFGYEIPGGIGSRTAGVWGGVGGQTDNVSAKFTGAERDAETGFDFLQARYQASLQGRFLSVDPGNAGASLETPGSWNGYVYVGNNPMAFLDPSGLCSLNADGTWVDDGGAPCANGTSINVSASGDTSGVVGSLNMTAPPGTCLSYIVDGVPQSNSCGSGVQLFTVNVATTPSAPVSKPPAPTQDGRSCLQGYYASAPGRVVDFGSMLGLVPGWSPNAKSNFEEISTLGAAKYGGLAGLGKAAKKLDVETIKSLFSRAISISSPAADGISVLLHAAGKVGSWATTLATIADVSAHYTCWAGSNPDAANGLANSLP